MTDDLYHQDILDHYNHPDNFGKLDHPDQVIKETNASCGDSFTFYIVLSNQKSVIRDLKFEGTGCAISTAACSMLTTKLKGQPLSALKDLNLDYMQRLIGTQITPTRLKCLLLPARALVQLQSST